MRSRLQHEQTVVISCSDNGKSKTADVLTFQPNQKLIVSLDKSIKMEMMYNTRNKLYIANQSGLEFVSSGPKITEYKEIRRR
jgi:hypothetical protein